MDKRNKYEPDPRMSLAEQARIFHGPRLARGNHNILTQAESLGWPVGKNRKATTKQA